MNDNELQKYVQTLLKSLSHAINNGTNLEQWWLIHIPLLPNHFRKQVLHSLSVVLSNNMKGISGFAQCLSKIELKNNKEFESVLFDFIIPIHNELISQNSWNEALNLESVIYSCFIKQNENYEFYEKAFASLYSEYINLFSKNFNKDQSTTDLKNSNKTLFWFQNYSILAHTQLVLDLAENLPSQQMLYASALTNTNLQNSKSFFNSAGIEVIPINDNKNIAERCQDLVHICKNLRINNIVFVSLPLQSGYFKLLAEGISLTWWSMKYPLGCLKYFDRLVCNRTLYPTKKNFNGTLWNCAPFSVKPLSPKQSNSTIDLKLNHLKLGVLAREEKFSSSKLPEIINLSLINNPDTYFFWTGRTQDLDLQNRLTGDTENSLNSRIFFSGWVEPSVFLNQIDILVDTPNLGGMVAYWMMSMGKVVVSATATGSVGALGSHDDILKHFEYLRNSNEVDLYFDANINRPYFLSSIELIPLCIIKYYKNRELLKTHGQRFFEFYKHKLSNLGSWSKLTHQMLNE